MTSKPSQINLQAYQNLQQLSHQKILNNPQLENHITNSTLTNQYINTDPTTTLKRNINKKFQSNQQQYINQHTLTSYDNSQQSNINNSDKHHEQNTSANPKINTFTSPNNNKPQYYHTTSPKQNTYRYQLYTPPNAINHETNPRNNTTNLSPTTYHLLNQSDTNTSYKSPVLYQKCRRCSKPTEKCCSLCRKAFYCSIQHQQLDWYTSHKHTCQGRKSTQPPTTHPTNPNAFLIYNDRKNQQQSISQQYDTSNDYQIIKKFVELLQSRLILRFNIMKQVSKLNEKTPNTVRQNMIQQCQKLVQLSTRITKNQYKPSFSRNTTNKINISQYSSAQWGSQVVVSQTGIELQYLADIVLMAKIYHMSGMEKQTRTTLSTIGNILEDPYQQLIFLNYPTKTILSSLQQNPTHQSTTTNPKSNTSDPKQNQYLYQSQNTQLPQDPFFQTKQLLLQSIIQISQLYNIDKTTQLVYRLYIKKIQLQCGIWQKIYAYFNIGIWYMKKTYYDKSRKTFIYCLELLTYCKNNTTQTPSLKSDCIYNIALCHWVQGNHNQAIQNLHQSYKLRVNNLGKNSMQSSQCLYTLAKWYKNLQQWNQCLQNLKQCKRVRQLYKLQPQYKKQLQDINILIAQVNQTMKHQPSYLQSSQDDNYYRQLLDRQRQQQQHQARKQQQQKQINLNPATITSKIFQDDQQYVKFKIVISEQLLKTIQKKQMLCLYELIEMTGKKMTRSQAIGSLMQNKFISLLDNEQRQLFLEENKIQNMTPTT